MRELFWPRSFAASWRWSNGSTAKAQRTTKKYSVIAITSLYGVDILEDNAEICRQKLFEIWDAEYTANAKSQANDQCRQTVKFILRKNILCGDALTLRQADGNPIVFAEWSLVTGNLIKRRDYELSQLLEGHEEQMSLDMVGWQYDEESAGVYPCPGAGISAHRLQEVG